MLARAAMVAGVHVCVRGGVSVIVVYISHCQTSVGHAVGLVLC